MSSIPLAVAVPAALGAAAYLNARSALWYDALMLGGILRGVAGLAYGSWADRLNLFYALEARALSASHADKPVLVLFDGGPPAAAPVTTTSYTYRELYDAVLRHGAYLRERLGVRPGDVVALDFQNSDTFVMLWWALWSLGAKPAFVNYNLTSAPLAHCIKSSTAKVCLVDPAVAAHFDDDLVRKETAGVEIVVFDEDHQGAARSAEPARQPDCDRSDKAAGSMGILIYTSGTTGLPKPAIVSWAKLIVSSKFSVNFLGRGDDVMYTCMPLYHASASLLGFCATVIGGSTLALGRKFSTKTFWPEVRASHATVIQYVGETLRYLLAAPPELDPVTGASLDRAHAVRVAFGNGLRPDVWKRFQTRFGVTTVAEFYGATEGTLATWNLSSNDHAVGAVGRAGWLLRTLVGRDTALAEMDWAADAPLRDPVTGLCRRAPADCPGEMLFRLPGGGGGVDDEAALEARFQGYFNDPSATRAKVLRDVFRKGDAWFRTGDVLKQDGDGLLFFVDRIGDTFRWKSENVSTAEVSQVMGLHPAVREANVYGVELPHHDGRAGCVTVCFGDDAAVPAEETLRSLAAHLRATLPPYAVPLFLRVVPGLGADTTGTNKQQKYNLRRLGVKPSKDARQGDASMFWLRGDTYVPFSEKDWKKIETGRLKL
ncbi:long-chain fatty acid transporter [Cordyceps fumosorosea ARSEF 2679]|uniref:Very long-chain fatty acid transport protein n=1 Tax=Cordyceps fumosorosea (strain ARSEF 2679) TaxID=1081104 RepID=A0A162J122_CORFA|nr:long-chain fatty acid transporter [Cordyceps fumosorosea ARSEF 2679]OAA62232.1 long-chain fatty acid transporter [Cordyceps fumosorosea ARSEF 2679]